MSSYFLDNFRNYFFYNNQTLLSEGRFVQFPNYGQIIFLVGGAGSGKNFVLENIIGHNGINCDVDDLKTYIAREKKFQSQQYQNKGNEFLQDMDFKDPDKVFQMHNFSKKIFEPKGSEMENSVLDGLLNSVRHNKNKDTIPNIVLNITGKDVEDFTRLATPFVEAGYKPSNVHIIWVLTPYSDASANNKKRDRVVPQEILKKTHEGVSNAMNILLSKGNSTIEYTHKGNTKRFNMRKFINGLVMIVFNKKGTDSWIPNKKSPDIKDKEGKIEKDFRQVTRGANEEGHNALKGKRYTNRGKLEYEDTSDPDMRPVMVDHVSKIVLKEIGQPFKSREEINQELQNTSKWIEKQQKGLVVRSRKQQQRDMRRARTGGQSNPIKSIDDFDKKVSEYTDLS